MVKNIFSLGELFEQVQIQNIFRDGKTFVDCTPLAELSVIQQRFEEEKNGHDFNLFFSIHGSFFVIKFFMVPNLPI